MLDNKKLEKLLNNFQDIQKEMISSSDDRKKYADLAIEFSNLEPIAKSIIDYQKLILLLLWLNCASFRFQDEQIIKA